MNGLIKILVPAVQTLYSHYFYGNGEKRHLASNLEMNLPLQEQDEEVDANIKELANQLANGVLENSAILDTEINKYLKGWKISRLGVIELALLRCGVYLLRESNEPSREIMEQIGNTAQIFGLDNACRFLTGLLESVADEKT